MTQDPNELKPDLRELMPKIILSKTVCIDLMTKIENLVTLLEKEKHIHK